MPDPQSSKPYFEAVATEWDAMRTEFFSDRVRDKAMAAAGLQAGALAADIGAGSGFITEGLLAQGARVIAVDQSSAMLERMRAKFGDAGISYREGDAERLPIEDGSVDCAFANMFLHHVEHPDQVIREMTRILAPGGYLVITDLDRHEYRWLLKEHHDRWPGFERADVRRWFEAAGLNEVVVSDAGEE